ncbi:MAG: DNA polymerase III subunit alpha [Alphaproteobacteria bacterium]|nr:DNA polymerase III subunit alpha [Alphaproteobacteria bacterium]
MPPADFIHLRLHSAYSLAEGALKVKELVKLCEKHAMPAVALTDTGNLFGVLDFASACTDAGIQPIVGCQLAIRKDEVEGSGAFREGRKPDPDPVVVLCQNETGYANLLKLVSKAFLETEAGETPQITLLDLETRADGLLLLSGGPSGPIGRLLQDGAKDKALQMALRLKSSFPGRFYIEIQRHGLDEERKTEAAFLDLAYDLDLPLLATNECFFGPESMYEAHDALLCIAGGAYVSQGERRRVTPEHRFKSAVEMRALFSDLPEAADNTLVVAKRCAFWPKKRSPILPVYTKLEGRSEEEALRQMAHDGLERRLPVHVWKEDMDEAERAHAAKPYRERLDYELDVIVKMGFPGYFLIVADFIQWSKEHDIPVGPGRGSGAGSVVAWALTITDLDPLRFNLLFERFLNPERVSMPDFDIDFCQDRRDEVIRYVQSEYGFDKVAQIITFGKLQARAALRDVGRVLEMPYGQVDRICKLIPQNPAKPVTIAEAIEAEPLLGQMREADPVVGKLLDVGQKLEGLYRHASTHAAGVVMGDRPLDELVPLYRDPRSDMPVTQFNMKWVEAAGLVKFDFLGLKTLTVLQKAVNLVAKKGIAVDLTALQLDDRLSFEMLGRGDTVGVFQLESAGMRDTVKALKPDTLEEIIAIVALYRPGPMGNIPSFIKRKHGEEEPDCLHPTLEPILKETFGIMVYQEQVMQIAQVLSGYTLGGADLLRRAMGKKNKEEMDAQRKNFVDGAVARKVSQAQASHIFDMVAKFAEYGFNKSHAAAYAVVAYQTAWMKANHPVEFIAASMTYDMGSTDKLAVFRQELERMKFKLLPPDVNRSEAVFSVEDGSVRYALAAIKNVGMAAMQTLVEERLKNGPFKDVADLFRRLDTRTLNRRQVENLIRAGAFDSLDNNRARLMDGLDILMREASSAQEERESGQVSLFGAIDPKANAPRLPNRADWPPMDRLKEEFSAIGFYLSAHPLDAYAKSLERLHVIKFAELAGHLAAGGKTRVKLAGVLIGKQERTSQRGSRFAFAQFSDMTGTFEVTLFSEVLAASRDILESGQPLLISLDARLEEEQIKLLAQEIVPLDQAAAKTSGGIKVYFTETAPVAELKALLAREARGKGRVILVPQTEQGDVEVLLKGYYALSPGLLSGLRALGGIRELREI